MKIRLLTDIAVDIQVCKLENWDYKEYIKELIKLLEDRINQ
nr:MAG TPA: hypothetical protein [Caudoviricetes sp.]